jgi:hypothetical protein
VGRQRAALERRILGAAQDVDRHDLPERARAHRGQRARDLRIVEQRVVDGDGLAPGAGQLGQRAALGGILGDRLLDEDVAAQLERGPRDLAVRRRRPARAGSRSTTPISSTSGSARTAATWNSAMLPAPIIAARKRRC